METKVLQVCASGTNSWLDVVCWDKICNGGLTLWIQRSGARMSVGERDSGLVGNPLTRPIAKNLVGNTSISCNLRDCHALQNKHALIIKNVVNFVVSVDMMLAFQYALEGRCRSHRQDEINKRPVR
jgi:hypothetical protein